MERYSTSDYHYIENVKLVFPESHWDGEQVDVLIHCTKDLYDNQIERNTYFSVRIHGTEGTLFHNKSTMQAIGTRVIKTEPGTCVSPGWFGIGVGLTEPRYDRIDDLEAIAVSAVAGGFGAVLCWPNANPVLDSGTALRSLAQRTEKLLPKFYAMAALTQGAEGKEMSEIYELAQEQAVAFSDGTHPLRDPGQLLRSLEYLQPTGRRLVQLPIHEALTQGGIVNESASTIRLGLRQQPALAEEFMVSQCLQVLAYAGGKLHFSPVTTAGSVQLIREAKAKGLDVTADTAPQYLFFDDSALSTFDSVFKVNPPLRTRADVEALQDALVDGTLDCISVQHFPQGPEDKDIEFDFAAYGMLTMECAFAALNESLVKTGKLSLAQLVSLLSFKALEVFGLNWQNYDEGIIGTQAFFDKDLDESKVSNWLNGGVSLTLFHPDAEWTVGPEHLRSQSRNCPWLGHTLRGKVVGTLRDGRFWRNEA